ncbi:MAG: hypothetical protein KIT02_10965 [Devosia sp.]|uniref:hypothetical protein n=1 Tax=Devosia sp. TaxID=1871048 RepID=UPI0024C7FF82|nr:hypothetical protein [Devosia sp.]UYN98477.1 MAG: hypothetical protein KIT02_10965 [Devosia sp.]
MDLPRTEPKLDRSEPDLATDLRAADDAWPPRNRAPVRPVIQRSRSQALPVFLALTGMVIGLAAAGGAYWLHSQAQAEILRLSTELAQLRVSLDLYARNVQAAAEAVEPVPEAVAAPADGEAGAMAVLPDIAQDTAEDTAMPSANEDCLPSGMRLLVAAGDNYPVCGQSAVVDVAAVDNGYVLLADGTTVPSGGTMPLAGSACMIGVTSGGDEGLTGYAEIRVSC